MGMDRLHRLVKDVDLFAVEAKHHPSCLRSFRTAFANYERRLSSIRKSQDENEIIELAVHEKAFSSALEHIKTHVVEANGIVRLVALRLLYVDQLKLNGYENPNNRAEKLMKRFQNHPISDKIFFAKANQDRAGALTFWLVCSSSITVSEVLSGACSLGGTGKCRDVALVLRGNILKAYKESEVIPWPPTAGDIELSVENILTEDLIRFCLAYLLLERKKTRQMRK